MNKGEITSKAIYKNAIEALLDDYSSNKKIYQQLFHESKANQSIHHHFLEGIYIKYSRNLEKYMKENRANMKLSGNKKYENVPIDLFIKESRVYKETIITELHNKYQSSNEESASSSLDYFFLTPLPDKPRVLLNTQQEKDEFQAAERLAVVMRTVEYTNALRNQGNQYYAMKKDERQQMVYILKRATNIIQDWWKTKGKEALFRRRRKAKEEQAKRQRRAYAIQTLNDLLLNKVNSIEERLFTQMRKLNRKRKEIMHYHLSFIPAYFRKKIGNRKWEYMSKKYRSLFGYTKHGNSNANGNNHITRLPQKESIARLQKTIKAFLKSKQLDRQKTKFLLDILRFKEKNDKRMLLKAFLKWIRLLYSPNRLKTQLKLLSHNFKQLGYTKLSKSLINIFQRRLLPLFSHLRYKQNKLKAFDKINSLLRNQNLLFGMKIIKQNILSDLLLKLLIRRNKLNYFWKCFSIWNILNLVVHSFINKLNHNLSKAVRASFLLQLTNSRVKGQSIPGTSGQMKQISLIKKIRYSSSEKDIPIKQIKLFPVYKGLDYFSVILLRFYFNKMKMSKISSPLEDKEGKRSMTCGNDTMNHPNNNDNDNTIKIYSPALTNSSNANKLGLILQTATNDSGNNAENKNSTNNTKKKSRVVIKAVKKYDSMERLDNDSDSDLFKRKKLKETENVIDFSRFTNKILTDSSGMKNESNRSHYNPYNTNKEIKYTTFKGK